MCWTRCGCAGPPSAWSNIERSAATTNATFSLTSGRSPRSTATNWHIGHQVHSGAPECTWCPICQFVAVLRGERPDVNEKVALVVAALRSMFDQAEGGPAQPQRVQHIDLGGEP